MKEELNIKNKLFLLILFSAALGLLSLLPESKIKKEKIAGGQNSTKEADKTSINCSDVYNSDLSIILSNQKNVSQESCLFVGCSGFNF